MKLFKRITAGVTALGLCAGMAISGYVPAAAEDDNNDDWLHAVGSRLYDKDGNEVWLTGANWFGFNCSENLAHGLYAADCDEFLSSVANHGINIVRMPISSELLISWMNGTPNEVSSVNAGYDPPTDEVGEDGSITPAGSYVNINKDFVEADGKTVKNSLEIFDVIMGKMKKYGLKVLVDVHSPAAHNSGHNYNLWYYNSAAEDADGMAKTADGKEVSYQDWIDSITWLAERYANDDTILAYDLKNEPHGKRGYSGSTCPDGIARWDDTDLENNWAHAATECGNSILNVNPNALILIEGVEQYPKTDKGATYDTADIWQASEEVSPWYGAWWGGNLRGVRDYPIDFGDAKKNSQIVYSPHDYGPSVYEQTWFNKDFTTETLLDDYWYDTWAYINEEDIAPLLIGEWGGHMDGGKNQKWMELLRDYMIDNHINHTFWCLNPNSGDTGGLLGYDFTTWDEEKYGLFEPSLWQTTDGTYIGLDHAHKLGDSGLTVTEYYASGKESNLDSGGKTDPVPVETVEPTKEPEPTETKAPEPTTETKVPEPTEEVPTSSETKTPDPTETEKITLGDVDMNESVDILDVILLNRYVLGKSDINATQVKIADVDKNGKAEPADALLIMKKIVKIIDEF